MLGIVLIVCGQTTEVHAQQTTLGGVTSELTPQGADTKKQTQTVAAPTVTRQPRNTTVRITQVELPFFLDGKEQGMIRAQLKGNALLTLHAASMYTFLSARMIPEQLSKIAYLWEDQKSTWIAFEEFAKASVAVHYDFSKVQLLFYIPVELRKKQVIRFNERSFNVDQYATEITPLTKSFILNNRLSLQHGQTLTSKTLSSQLNLNGALRLDPWVVELDTIGLYKQIENTGSYSQSSAIRRGDFSLVRDYYDDLTRFRLGDITHKSASSVSSQALLGLTYERMNSLDPQATRYSKPSQVLTLPNGAAADVYINGALARSLRLEAGVHDLQQLPVNNGANDVNIRITEPGKPPVWYKQSFFFDSQLLARDVHDYQMSVGVPRMTGGDAMSPRQYSHDDPQLISTHRVGASYDLTLGTGFQWGLKSRKGFIEWVHPLANGLASSELTHLSYTKRYIDTLTQQATGQLNTGLQFKTQWIWRGNRTQREGFHSPTVSTQFNIRSGVYTATEFLNMSRTEFGLRLAASYKENNNYSFSVKQNLYDDGMMRGIYGTWTHQINHAWTLDTVFSVNTNHRASRPVTDPAMGKSLLLTMRWHPKSDGYAGYGLSSAVDLYHNKAMLEYHQQDQTSDGLWRFSANQSVQGTDATLNQLDLKPDQYLSNAHMQSVNTSYLTSRYEVEGQFDRYSYNLHNSTTSTNQYDKSQAASLYFSNAIGYGAGLWFVSRPITDSAAVLSIQKKLNNAGVYMVDTHPAAAKQDGMGPPTISPLTLALKQEVVIDADRLERGQSLGADRFILKPTYRSLSIIPVGVSAQTQITGVLVDDNNKPAGLTALFIQNLEKEESFDVFTNRSGIFFSPALKLGKYKLTTVEGELILNFEVKEDSPWKINFDSVKLPKAVVKQ